MFKPYPIPLVVLLFACFYLSANTVNAQLRIVSYNTTPTINSGLAEVLTAIGVESVNGIQRPIDVLALQEQPTHRVETQAVVDILNGIYGAEIYARGNLTGAGFFTQGVVYNTQTVQLISEQRVGTTSFNGAPRQGLRYQFRPVGYQEDADLFIYNSHFKANDTAVDAARRAVEAESLRTDAEGLGADASIIYLGDLNLYRNNEAAFQTLVEPGVGQAIDPVDQVGRWHASNRYKRFHTQSTTLAGGENRAGGGVDDRFDFQLVTDSLMNGEGISYIGPNVPNSSESAIRHSYRVFGNNGTHFTSRNISTGTGASSALLNALESASDHLPVVVDYQLPAAMQVAVDFPSRVIVDTDVNGTTTVANVANVRQTIAADELDYSIVSFSSVNFSATGRAIATLPPAEHTIELDTAALGEQSMTMVVSADEPATAGRLQSVTVDYQVLAHSNPSFAHDQDTNELLIDIGNFQRDNVGESIPFQFDIHNFGDPMQADLMVPSVSLVDNNLDLTLADSLIAAGQHAKFSGKVFVPEFGGVDLDISIATFDEPIPGSSSHAPLKLRIVGNLLSEMPGDFDGNNELNAKDIDALSTAIRNGAVDDAFDVNHDGNVDPLDRDFWVTELANSFFGDSNLDGEFDSRDIVGVFQSNEFRDAIAENSTWLTGDWDGDTEFDTSDLILAFQQGRYENGPRTIMAIPEPHSRFWLTLFCCGNVPLRRIRRARKV